MADITARELAEAILAKVEPIDVETEEDRDGNR